MVLTEEDKEYIKKEIIRWKPIDGHDSIIDNITDYLSKRIKLQRRRIKRKVGNALRNLFVWVTVYQEEVNDEVINNVLVIIDSSLYNAVKNKIIDTKAITDEHIEKEDSRMNMKKFSKDIEVALKNTCDEYESMGDGNDAWNFSINDSVTGFVSIEEPDNYIDDTTISISVITDIKKDYTKDELLKLFECQSDLWRSRYGITYSPQLKKYIETIDYRMLASSFNPEEFSDIIDFLMYQHAQATGD